MTKQEKLYWLLLLRRGGFTLLADHLELEWFPTRRRGRRSRSEWSPQKIIEHNGRAEQLKREVEAEARDIKAKGDSRSIRDDAEVAVAARHGISKRQLQRRMQPTAWTLFSKKS